MHPISFWRSCVAIVCLFTLSPIAQAHFPWLDIDEEGRPILFFGEDVTDRTYHLPESLAQFPLEHLSPKGQTTDLEMASIGSDDFVGLRASQKLSDDQFASGGVIEGTATYGVYHGSKLVYYIQHFVGTDPAKWPAKSSLDLAVSVSRGDAASNPGGAAVKVTRGGRPLVDAEVKIFCDEGHEEGAAKTNDQGVVEFKSTEVEDGLNAVMVGVKNSDEGKLNDVAFGGSMHYLTATFQWQPNTNFKTASPTDSGTAKSGKAKSDSPKSDSSLRIRPEVSVQLSGLPSLPLELTSFGGITAGDKLYVYGGHTGSAHSYSTAEQSNQFWCLDLNSPKAWTTLPGGPRLQGLALVADGKSVIRIGGFTAMNAEGEEHDLRSQTTVSRFDVAKQHWTDLAALPEPRSSLAAAVIGRRVYVAGGWSMQSGKTTWHRTAWSLDLDDPDASWEPIAQPPFERRALALAEFDGKLYAIGGMNQDGGPTKQTAVYDPELNLWSAGPNLVGEPMTGFGNAAFSMAGRLYVSTVSGNIQRLSQDRQSWEIVSSWDPGRFFHVMVPRGDRELLLVGGANMEIGKFTEIESVHLK